MNKTLMITLAATSLIIAPTINADTTLYGSLHTSIDIVDDGSDSNNISLSNNQSYFGVKGSEKITDDLSAVYKIEFGPDMGGKGRDLDDRDQYVGLSSKQYGSVLAGKMSSPYKILHAKADLFWYSQLGSNRSLATDGYRNDNTIAYFSPKIGGFTAALAHVTEGQGNEGSQNDDRNIWSGNLFYKVGGMTLGAGYEKDNSVNEAVNLMASYQMGKFKVVGFAERMEFSSRFIEEIVAQDSNTDVQPSSKTDVGNNTYGIGASMKTKNGIVKAQYYTQKHTYELPEGYIFPTADNKTNLNSMSKLFSIGYDYKLSKRTTIYAQYALSKNDNAFDTVYHAQLGTNSVSNPGGRDSYSASTIVKDDKYTKKVSGVSFGIKHNF